MKLIITIVTFSMLVLSSCAQVGTIQAPNVELNKYIVRPGDSIESIAYRYRIEPEQLRELNNLTAGNALRPGLRLSLMRIATVKKNTKTVKKIRKVTPKEESVIVATRPISATKAVVVPASVMIEPNEEILESVEISKPRVKKRVPISKTHAHNAWVWPSNGRVAKGFKPREINRSGLDIKGQTGDQIVAAADGVVIYGGDDLASHGKLVILQHTDNLLTAYSLTEELFVQEGEAVKAGDSIASLGRGNSAGAMLHFEIRENGEPVDPLKYLPKR